MNYVQYFGRNKKHNILIIIFLLCFNQKYYIEEDNLTNLFMRETSFYRDYDKDMIWSLSGFQ